LAEWLYETGIGENRAILVEDGRIIEARIEWPGLRVGTVANARLTRILMPGRRGIATLDSGDEVLVEPLDRTTEGGIVHVEIVREAIPEPGAVKRAKGRITGTPLCDGTDLATQVSAQRVIGLQEPDAFEDLGWSELLEQATTGIVPFVGGTVRISLTPAMTLVDIDGTLPPLPLAMAAAKAAARAIRLFGITGNIGVDLPTVAGKTERTALAEAFDAELPPPFERTAVNGFGFLQLIRPRTSASILERAQFEAPRFAAVALIRRIQHARIVGAAQVTAPANVIDIFHKNQDWLQQLERQNGGSISLRIDQNTSVMGI
jgi:hypothetical protein